MPEISAPPEVTQQHAPQPPTHPTPEHASAPPASEQTRRESAWGTWGRRLGLVHDASPAQTTDGNTHIPQREAPGNMPLTPDPREDTSGRHPDLPDPNRIHGTFDAPTDRGYGTTRAPESASINDRAILDEKTGKWMSESRLAHEAANPTLTPVPGVDTFEQRVQELRDTATTREAREAREAWPEERRARERAGALHVGVPRLRTDIPRHENVYQGPNATDHLNAGETVRYRARIGEQGNTADAQAASKDGRREHGRLAAHITPGENNTERVTFNPDTRDVGPHGSATNPIIELRGDTIAILNGGENPITYPLSAFEQGVLEIPLSDNTSLIVEQPNGETGEVVLSTRVPEQQVPGDTIVLPEPMPLPEPNVVPESVATQDKEPIRKTLLQKIVNSPLGKSLPGVCVAVAFLQGSVGAPPPEIDQTRPPEYHHIPSPEEAPPVPGRIMTPAEATNEGKPAKPFEQQMKEKGKRIYRYDHKDNPNGTDSQAGLVIGKELAGELARRDFQDMQDKGVDPNSEEYKKLAKLIKGLDENDGKWDPDKQIGVDPADPTLGEYAAKANAMFEPGGKYAGRKDEALQLFRDSLEAQPGQDIRAMVDKNGDAIYTSAHPVVKFAGLDAQHLLDALDRKAGTQ